MRGVIEFDPESGDEMFESVFAAGVIPGRQSQRKTLPGGFALAILARGGVEGLWRRGCAGDSVALEAWSSLRAARPETAVS